VEEAEARSDDDVDERIAGLRAELKAASERSGKATLHYELGHLLESSGDLDGALREYDAARKADSSFRLALFALVRIHRQRGDDAKLADLYATGAKVAKTPSEEASALLEHAALLEDALGRDKQARALYDRVIARDPGNLAASLMLERMLRQSGDARGAAKVVRARAEHESDPVAKRVLILEGALDRERDGDAAGALEELRGASNAPQMQVRFLRELERLSRSHGLVHDRIEVMERLARIAERRAKGEAVSQGLSAGSLPPFADEAEAIAVACTLLREIALLLVTEDDARGALRALDRAVAIAPKDLLLRYERLGLHERLGDFGNAQKDARELVAAGGPTSAAIHLRMADLATRKGNRRARREALEAAVQADPGSAIATALLEEELLANAEPSDRITWLTNAARDPGAPDRQKILWRAARMAAYDLGSDSRSRSLYLEAASAGPARTAVLRDGYGAALHLGAEAFLSEAIAELLASQDLDPRERSALLYERYRRLRSTDGETATRLLADLRDDPNAPPWVADVLRLTASERKDLRGLAAAHLALGRRAADGEENELAVAHAAAAGRALGRVGDLERAAEVLRGAMERAPEDDYVRTLLEEVLRARGEGGDLSALLLAAGDGAKSARVAEPLLLRAAYAAKEAGDIERAFEACRRAAAKSPDSVAPRWAMWRIARDARDDARSREAVEALAVREMSTGRASVAALALGEVRAFGGDATDHGLKELSAVLSHDTLGAAAAVAMLVAMPDEGSLTRALERLLEEAHGASAKGLRRTLGGLLLGGVGSLDRLRQITRRVLDISRDDRWARWASLRLTGSDASQARERSLSFEGLGSVTTDAKTGAELLLYALWSDPDTDDDERRHRLVEEIESLDPEGLVSTMAAEGAVTSASSAAAALSSRLGHATEGSHSSVDAAMGRALVLAGRHAEAVRVLRRATEQGPDEISAWEALRVAAKAEHAFEALVAATERLAPLSPPHDRAQLLTEAGLCLSEHLGRSADAESRFRDALEIDPSRRDAFEALHDIVAAREDKAALADIIAGRIAVTDDSEELTALFWEHAGLLRALGRTTGAVDALKNLLVLTPDHAPALALLAECHASAGEFEASVEALRSLASVDLPVEERRDARLAAARYLMQELGDPGGAYQELKVIENMGLGEEALSSRMALLAEQAQMYEEAVEALKDAAEMTEGADRARYESRAAVIHRAIRNDEAAAIDAYRRALTAVPTDETAAAALAELLDRAGRRRLAASFDLAIREQMRVVGTTPGALRKLRSAATWADDHDYERLILEALFVLGSANAEEEQRWAALVEASPRTPRGQLSDESLAALGGRGLAGPVAEIVNLGSDVALALDGADLKGLGVGRREIVKDKDDSLVRDAVTQIGGLFTVDADRFHIGGSPAGGVALVGSRMEPAAWVVSEDVQSPLSSTTRFRAATLAMAHHEGALPLLSRNVEDGVGLVAAFAIAGDRRLEGSDTDDGLAAQLRKALSRNARKSLERLATETNIAHVRDHCRSVRAACLRAGLTVAGDLRASLAMVLADPPSLESVASSTDAFDLFAFWLSPEHRAIRAELGFDAVELNEEQDDLERAAERLERASGFFGVRAEEVEWEVGAEDMLGRVRRAGPREPSLVTGTHPAVPPVALPDLGERLALVVALADASDDPQLLLSAAEIADARGDHARARELTGRAGKRSGDDVVALWRRRAAALARGAWAEVAECLETEAALPTSPEERGLCLCLLAVVALARLGDVSRARDAAKRALSQRPKSAAAALLSALLSPRGDAEGTALALERAAREWEDGKASAALLVEAAQKTQRAGDLTRARFLFKRAATADPDALDATVGLARAAFAQRGFDEASEALVRAAKLINDRHLGEAFLRCAARIAHVAGNKPAHATSILAEVTESPAVEALATAAEDAHDRDSLTRAAAACAAATSRTARALWLVRVAELRSDSGDERGAAQALRDAAHADQTLDLIRVVGGAIARRSGDRRELARLSRSTGLGPLAASARVAFDRKAFGYELRLLADAAAMEEPSAAALLVATDAAAEAGDREGLEAAARREAERQTRGQAWRLLAIADLADAQGDTRGAARVLREVRRADSSELAASRRLAELIRERAPEKAARLWQEEGELTGGDLSAFAHLVAAGLLADDDAEVAAAHAHVSEASPGYPPGLWANEERARKSNDPTRLRELVLSRAEDIPDPRIAAETLIRAAFAAPEPDPDLLRRASELIPEDAALGDVRLRLGGLDPLARAELFENATLGASLPLARAMSIRAAEALSEGGEHARAAEMLDAVLDMAGGDAIARAIRDRCLRAANDVNGISDNLAKAVLSAPDDVSRALALERAAEHELLVRGDSERAQGAYQDILGQYPSHVASNRAVERLSMERGDDDSLARIEEDLARLGSPADAADRARFAVRLHRKQKSPPEEGERVLRHTFDYGEVDVWLAREIDAVARQTGDRRLLMQAWAELSDLLEESRERMAAELRLAEITANLRSASAAQSRLSRAQAIDLKYPTTGEILGRLRQSAGDPVGAAEAYEDGARRSRSAPRKAALSTLAGTLYEGAGDPERAAKAYFAAAKSDAKHGDVLARLMRLLPTHRQAKAVAELLTRRITMGGEKSVLADHHRMLARVRIELGDPAAAKKSLKTVTTLDPARLDALEDLARICVETNDSRGAAEAFQKIVIGTQDATILRRAYIGLANVFESQRDVRRTKEVLRKMVELFPNDSEAKQRLALMEAR